jgi:hypothetical protein
VETGTKISFGLHGAIIVLVAFGGPLFNSDESKAIQISEVSIITSADFDAMMSSAPVPEVVQPEQTPPSSEAETATAPVVETPPEETAVPEVEQAAAEEKTPDVSAIAKPVEPVRPVESPQIAEQATEATGATLVVPDAQVSTQDQSGQVAPDELALARPKPRAAPRIDTTIAPKPSTDAADSKEAVDATKPEDTAKEPVEQKEANAPKESTTEIVTEAEQDPNSAAPVKSARPKGRPADIVENAKAAKEQAVKQLADAEATKDADVKAAAKAATDAKAAKAADAKAAKEADAKAIEAALKAATSAASVPSGPPMTGSEKGALVLAVQRCWTPPIGVQNAADLVVVLSIELTKDGKLKSSPTLIEPKGAQSDLVKVAFRAGRQALIACAPYDLPKDKYEHWRQIEVVFDPKKMVMK